MFCLCSLPDAQSVGFVDIQCMHHDDGGQSVELRLSVSYGRPDITDLIAGAFLTQHQAGNHNIVSMMDSNIERPLSS